MPPKCAKHDCYYTGEGAALSCPQCNAETGPTKVIHLAFRSPHVEDDTMAYLSCKHCKNKTYTLTQDKLGEFPLMRCAACGSHVGRMGWAHDDDPMLTP